jgi:hypothetical protein
VTVTRQPGPRDLAATEVGAILAPDVVPEWYRGAMDINVKGLDPQVARRLAEQASAEGMSQQEWIRQVLRQTANRLSPGELVAQRETLTPMSESEFVEVRAKVALRRRSALEHLDAGHRRR